DVPPAGERGRGRFGAHVPADHGRHQRRATPAGTGDRHVATPTQPVVHLETHEAGRAGHENAGHGHHLPAPASRAAAATMSCTGSSTASAVRAGAGSPVVANRYSSASGPTASAGRIATAGGHPDPSWTSATSTVVSTATATAPAQAARRAP